MGGKDPVEDTLEPDDLFCLDIDVSGSTFGTAPGLMDHDAAVGQRVAFARSSGRKKHRPHGGTLSHAIGLHITGDHLHGVIDGEPCGNGTAGTADVKRNIFGSILSFKKEELKIELQKDLLTVSAEKTESKEEESKEENRFLRKERFIGTFKRSFTLSGIEQDAITASFEDGLLTLTLPKKEKKEEAVRQIAIA